MIVSAVLMYLFDWMIADPICSIFIAILIALSVWSLVSESVAILMQRQPKELDDKLPECYNKVRNFSISQIQLKLVKLINYTIIVFYKQKDIILIHCKMFQVMQLEGVQGVQETHFWTLCSNHFIGALKLEVSSNADQKYIVSHTQMIFRSVGVTQVYVQLDYEHHQSTYQNLKNFYQ